MKINIQYSLEVDLESLYFAILLVRIGFFKERNFLLSSKLSGKIEVDHVSVLIPPEVIAKGKEFIRDIGGKNPEKLYTECLEYKNHFNFDKDIQNSMKSKESEMQEYANEYNKNFGEKLEIALKALYDFFPLDDYIKNINIYFKTTGTVCSYRMIQNKECRIEPRIDASISDIVFCILCSFIHEFYSTLMELDKGMISWEEKQRMAEFVITRSKISKITGPYNSINQYLDSKVYLNNSNLVEESNQIYEKIGYPSVSKIECLNNQIIANGSKVENLTDQEENLLRELVKNSGTLLTYDQIAEKIWEDDSYAKFSIQAIQKTIERIRKKLDYYGVSSSMLVNRAGKGYMYIE